MSQMSLLGITQLKAQLLRNGAGCGGIQESFLRISAYVLLSLLSGAEEQTN